MKPTPNRILVRFHEVEQGIIAIPERFTAYTQQSEDDNESRHAVTTDRRLINPQVVDVLSGKYSGEQAFVYYGAYETAKWIDGHGIIEDRMLLFLLNPIRMLNKNRLCETIWRDGEKTASGIYITSDFGGVEAVRVKDTQTGEVIITVDSAQYPIKYKGNKYILVKDQYIAGIDEHPYGNNLLIEYLPDDDNGRQARNEEKRRQRDLMDSYRMFYNEVEYADEPLPKFANAIVIDGAYAGSEVIVERAHGVGVSKGRAIIPPDALVAVKNGGHKTSSALGFV